MSSIEALEYRTLLSTTYYVDPAAAGANTGLTPVDAWVSLPKVNAASFLPGDSILFRAGRQSAVGQGLVFGADDGTTAPAGGAVTPVVLDTYENFTLDPLTGAYTPTGVGAGTFTVNAGGATNGLLARNTGGFDVSHLTFAGANQANASFNGIWFDNALSGNVKLPHVHIDHVNVGGFGKYGITVGGSSGKSGFDDVRIEYANVHHNTLGGVETHGVFSGTATTYANTNVYVGHTTARQNPGYAGSPNHSGDGIVLSDADGVTIERSVAYENGAANTHVGGPVGIWVWDVNDAVIQHNESHHNKTNSTADGGGFDFDGGVTNSVMQYNYSHDNDGAGYGIYQFQGARPFHDIVVRYNISANDGRRNTYGAIDFWNGNGGNGISNVDVYNNTVYVTPSTATTTTTTTNKKGQTTTTTTTTTLGHPRALRFTTGTTNVRISNNIFQTTGGVQLAEILANQNNLQVRGNDYWSSGAAFSLKVFSKTYTSFSAYVSGSGFEKIGSATVGKNADPSLALPPANPPSAPTLYNADLLESGLGGFKLTAASAPLVGGGINLVSQYGIDVGLRDFYGNALPAAGFDIGAHEYA